MKQLIASVSEAAHEQPHDVASLYDDFDFFGNVSGHKLTMQWQRKPENWKWTTFGAWVSTAKCPAQRHSPTDVRSFPRDGLILNKGDDKKPNCRSRLVGKEIKKDKRLDLFAAMLPLEAVKAVLFICASSQYKKKPHRLMSIDVSRAFVYAKARRLVFFEIQTEDLEPGDDERVAKLSLSLYGTRDKAQIWAKEYPAAAEPWVNRWKRISMQFQTSNKGYVDDSPR